MRVRHIVAIAAIVVIGFGVKVLVSSTRAQANLDTPKSVSMNVLQMQRDHPNMKNIPVQKLHDTTFVFSDGD
jgi:hypothetical protein